MKTVEDVLKLIDIMIDDINSPPTFPAFQERALQLKYLKKCIDNIRSGKYTIEKYGEVMK